jgi:hypothetical protein
MPTGHYRLRYRALYEDNDVDNQHMIPGRILIQRMEDYHTHLLGKTEDGYGGTVDV